MPEPEEPDGQTGADLELWQRAAQSISQLIGGGLPAARVLEPDHRTVSGRLQAAAMLCQV